MDILLNDNDLELIAFALRSVARLPCYGDDTRKRALYLYYQIRDCTNENLTYDAKIIDNLLKKGTKKC